MYSRSSLNFFVCLVSLSFVFCLLTDRSLTESTQRDVLGLLKYEIVDLYVGSFKHNILIVNPSLIPVRGEFFIPLIRNVSARRYVILDNISQDISPSKVNDDYGNIYLHWDDLRIDKRQTFSVELNYYVLSFNIRYLVDSESTEQYDTTSDLYKKFTNPEELIECNDSEMVSLANNLTGNANGWHEKASEIYNFVRRHIHYEEQDEERGALWALENRVGDCSEYSYLFVALCRAAGIPARIQAGFAFHSRIENLKHGHMWSEYYLAEYGWIPVDVTWQLFDEVSDKHFSSIQSVPEITPYANYFFDSGLEDGSLEDDQLVSIVPCSEDVFETSIVKDLVSAVQQIKRTRFAVFLEKLFGTHLIFPSEVMDVEQNLYEVEIQLQNAIDFWYENPQIAEHSMANALENVEITLQNAWMVIVKAFAIFISIPIAIALITLMFLRRYQTKPQKEPQRQSEVSFP